MRDEKMGAWSVLHWGARSECHSEAQWDFQTELNSARRTALRTERNWEFPKGVRMGTMLAST
jgi:hypothetical protein